jgi:hypothetical protein
METLVLTIDAIRDWLNCRRLYYYRHFCCLTSGNPKYSKMLESVVKKCLYRWHMGIDLSEILWGITIALADLAKLGGDNRHMEWLAETEPMVRQIVKEYAECYQCYDSIDCSRMTFLDSSSEILVPIRNVESGRKSRGWFLKVTPDLLFEVDGKGRLIIWDIRSRFGDHYEKWLKLNLMIPYLMYAMQEHTKHSIDRVHVRMIRKQKPKKGEQFTERVFFNRRDGAFEEAIRDLYAIALDIWTCSKEGDAELFYRNPSNCQYYRCEYQPICFSGGDIGEIKKYKVLGDDNGRAI